MLLGVLISLLAFCPNFQAEAQKEPIFGKNTRGIYEDLVKKLSESSARVQSAQPELEWWKKSIFAGGERRSVRLKTGQTAEVLLLSAPSISLNGHSLSLAFLLVKDKVVDWASCWYYSGTQGFLLEDVDGDGFLDLAFRQIHSPSFDQRQHTRPGDERVWLYAYTLTPRGLASLFPNPKGAVRLKVVTDTAERPLSLQVKNLPSVFTTNKVMSFLLTATNRSEKTLSIRPSEVFQLEFKRIETPSWLGFSGKYHYPEVSVIGPGETVSYKMHTIAYTEDATEQKYTVTLKCSYIPPALLSRATRLVPTTDWPGPVSQNMASRSWSSVHGYSWLSADTLIAIKSGSNHSSRLVEINVNSGQERRVLEGVPLPDLAAIHTSPDGQKALLQASGYRTEGDWICVQLQTSQIIARGMNSPMSPDLPHVGQATGLWKRDSLQWVEMTGSSRGTLAEVYTMANPGRPRPISLPPFPSWVMSKPSLVGWNSEGKAIATRSMPGAGELVLYTFDVEGAVVSEDQRQRAQKTRIRLPKGAACEEWAVSHQGDRLALMLSYEDQKKHLPSETIPGRAELWIYQTDGKPFYPVGAVTYERGPLPIGGGDHWNKDLSYKDFPMQISWLPDDKRLSFIYKDALWTVPVD